MPKPILNNRINYQDIIGRVIEHSTYFNQPIKVSSSPTFANLYLSEDLNVNGNLYVGGNSTIFSSDIIEFSDNIILVNNTETNNGVTLQYAGLEVERGLGENFRIVFNETTGRLETGFLSSLSPVAIREDSPLNGRIFVWNDSLKKIEGRDIITIPITFGNLQVSDTLSFPNTYLKNTTGSLYLNQSNFLLDFDSSLYLGNTSQSVSADSLTGDLTVQASGDIYFTNTVPKKIRINGEVPITFSTVDESIYADFANNMTITSSQDIYLYPNKGLGGKKVLIPYDSSLSFGDTTNSIYSDTASNLYITSTNILEDLKFGNSRIYSTTGNGIVVNSNNVFFGTGGGVSISENSVGNLVFNDYGKSLDIETDAILSGNLMFKNGLSIGMVNSTVEIKSSGGSYLVLRTNVVGTDGISELYTVNNSSKLTTYKDQKLKIETSDSNAFNVTDSFVINTVQQNVNSGMSMVISNTTQSTDISNGSLMVLGGAAIQKNLNVLGNAVFNSGANMNNNRITNIGEPLNTGDAVTKNYVDTLKQGLFVKDAVEAATTLFIDLLDLESGYVVDGFTLSVDDRVLVKNQVNGIENGIYKVTNSGGVRTDDFSTGVNASGFFCFVKEGTVNKSLGWICNSSIGSDTVGTNNLSFTQFTGLGQITPGDGLSKTFNELDVKVDNFSISFEPVTTNLRIKSDTLGTGLTGGNGSIISVLSDLSHVTKLGTIDTGVWNGNVINVQYGGTGLTQVTSGSILYGNGTSSLRSSDMFIWDNNESTLRVGSNVYIKDSFKIDNLTGIGEIYRTSGSLTLNDTQDVKINISNTQCLSTNTSGTFVYNGLTVSNGTSILGTLELNGSLEIGNTVFTDTLGNLSLYRNSQTTSNFILTDTGVVFNNVQIGNTQLVKNTESNLEITGTVKFAGKNQVVIGDDIRISNTNGTSITTKITNNSLLFESTSGSLLVLNTETKIGDSFHYIPGNTTSNLNLSDNLNVTIDGPLYYNGMRSLITLRNNFTSNSMWYYAGALTSGNLQYRLDDNNSKSIVGIYKNQWTNVPEIKHNYSGNTIGNTISKIYSDTVGNYHLFFTTKINSFSNLFIDYSDYNLNVIEGNEPDNSWTLVDSTEKLSNNNEYSGNHIVNNLVLFSEGNDAGIFIERDSDNVINGDSNVFVDSIPSQTLLNGDLNILKLSTFANSSDDYYNNYTILFASGVLTGLTRKITKYIGAQRLAYINVPFPSVPGNGDSIEFFNNAYFVQYLDETTQKVTSGYVTKRENDLQLNKYGDHLVGTLETISDISVGKEIVINGTGANSIYNYGGAYLQKDLTVRNIILGNNTGGEIYLPLSKTILKDTSNGFSIRNTLGNSIVLFNSIGNIILETSVIASNVTYGNIGIYSGNTTQSRILMNHNNLYLYSNSVNLNDSLYINNDGTVLVTNTQNATSSTSGGALTISGGTSIKKDVYIGGDLVVEGSFSSSDTLSQPTLTESNLVNCTFDNYDTVYMVKNGTVRNLFFSFIVTPTVTSENTEVQFLLPERISSFSSRLQVVSNASGFVDSSNVIPLMNIVSCGITGTSRLLVKFQSNGIGSHYLQINCLYSAS